MRRFAALTTLALLVAGCGGGESGAPSSSSSAPVTAAVPSAGDSAWEQLPSMPTPRSELPAVALGGEIYAPGGYAANDRGRFRASAVVEAYDPVARSWRQVADLPSPRHHAMGAAYGGRLFVFGGFNRRGNPASTAWSYDPAADAWARVADLPRGSAAGTAVTVGDHIFVIGGVPKGRFVYRYDPALDTWESMARMSEASEHLAAAALDGKIYVVAGRWNNEELTRVEVYDVATDHWAAAEPIGVARARFGAAASMGRIIVAGGEVVGSGDTLDSVEILDLGGSWAPGPRLPAPVHGNGLVALDDAIFSVGGSSIAGGVVNHGDMWVLRLADT